MNTLNLILSSTHITIYTLFYLMLICLLKPMVLNKNFDANWAIMTTLVLFLWMYISKGFANMLI